MLKEFRLFFYYYLIVCLFVYRLLKSNKYIINYAGIH